MNNFFITIGHSSLNIPDHTKERINSDAILLELAEPGLIEVCDSFQNKKVIFDLHRAILDVNRSRNNIDPKIERSYPLERGLFPTGDFQGNRIYKAGKELNVNEKNELLNSYYDTFFQQIDNLIGSNEYSFFIDIHLMNDNISSYEMKSERPDITVGNLGDPDGEICLNRPSTTISPKKARDIKSLFEDVGLSCKLNRPFAGGYIMMKYLTKFPCFQLEINKRVLMDSDSSMPNPKKLKDLKFKLEAVFNKIA